MKQSVVYIGIDVAKAHLDVAWAGTFRRQAAALAGLAPFNHDSGSVRGKRAIFGGRPALRSGLYMPHSPPLVSIRSCRAFTNVCVPKANCTN